MLPIPHLYYVHIFFHMKLTEKKKFETYKYKLSMTPLVYKRKFYFGIIYTHDFVLLISYTKL